ncbi:MAG: tetratricopeptide repeat protein [Deltaproteobacteria bacterium]|nr:tetratricopeptide repeat protein [Deltaproteobacteria bacterium]
MADFHHKTLNLFGSTALAVLLTLAPTSAHAQRGFRIPMPGSSRAPTPFELAVGRGDQALRQGRLDEAQTQFNEAERLNPRDARPAFYLGEIARRRDDYATAERQFRIAIQRNDRMAEAHASLGAVLRELRRGSDARAAFQRALTLDPQLAEAHYGLALCLEDDGDSARAVSEYRSAIRLSPRDAMAPLNLGILLANTRPARGSQPRAEALAMLQSALRNGSDDTAVLISAGPALRTLGEFESSAGALERARTRSPQPSASLLAELAQSLWAAGHRPMALTRIAEAVTRAPSSAELHYVRGLMLAESGDRAGALSALRLCVQHGGDTPLAQRARQRLTALGSR